MRRTLICFAFAVSALFARPAAAQDDPIDIERFKPAVTADSFVITEGTDIRWTPDESRVQLGVAGNGAWNPLVTVQDSEISDRIVSGRAGFDLFGSLSLDEGLALGLDVPLFAAQAGVDDPRPAGVGDLRVVPKIRILDDAKRGIGLAVVPEIRLPTHSDEQFSGGARSAVFAPRLAVDHRFGQLRLGANLGLLVREATLFRNIRAASEFTYSAAAELDLDDSDGYAALGVDLYGGVGLAELDLEEAPLEGQLYLRVQPTPELQLDIGPAMGLVAGYGTPTARVYAGLRWSPKPRPVPEPVALAGAPAPCPELTLARFAGPGMGLVNVTVLDAETEEPIERARARVDDVPTDPTGKIGQSSAEVEPGEHILWVRARGYFPQRIEIEVPRNGVVNQTVYLEPAVVTITDDRLEFDGTVYFAFDSAALVEESHDLLDEVGAVLNAHPELKLIRVEGHADATGPTAYNQRLSERRAESVRGYLLSIGVDSERLISEGYGESRPVSQDYSKNRRVEFVILKGKVDGAKIFNADDR